jgi:hypothetical protein
MTGSGAYVGDDGNALVIRSEADAWAVLEAAVSGETSLDAAHLRFEGWPVWSLDAKGHDWQSTVPTRIMPPLLDVQKDINRAFAGIRYGDANLRRLRDDERDELEVVVKVEKGSSLFTADLSDQLIKIAEAAIGRMNGVEALIAVLSIGLMITSPVMYKAWLNHRIKEKELQSRAELDSKNIEARIQQSQEETRRMEIMRDAMTRQPALRSVEADVQITANRFLKATRPGDRFETKGVPVTAEEAHEIAQPEREHSRVLDIQGDFAIIGNRTDKGDGFRITVRRQSDQLQFVADVMGDLPPNDKQAIQDAEWTKSLVTLSIEAEMLREKISRASVISAKPVKA